MLFILAKVEELGVEPIFDIMNKIGLPREIPTDETKALDVARVAGTAQRTLGLTLLVNLYISEDIRDTTQNRMTASCLSFVYRQRTTQEITTNCLHLSPVSLFFPNPRRL